MTSTFILFCLSLVTVFQAITVECWNVNHNHRNHYYPTGHYWAYGWSTNDHQKWIESSNKNIVLNFYQEFFGDKNIEAADKYIDPHKYIQHNPTVPDGREAFKREAIKWFQGAPKETVDIKRAAADGDLVWLHIKTNEDGKVGACIDIFRLECGKIVEHWDVMQKMPETAANEHPLF